MKRRDLRLLPVAGVAWAAALLCVFIPQTAWWVVAGCGVLCILALGRRNGLALVALAAAAAVSLGVGLAAQSRAAAAVWDGRIVEVVGEIASSASMGSDGQLWFDAQLHAIGPPGSATGLSAPIRIGVQPGDGYDLGAGIRVVGQVAATDAGERAALVVFASRASIEYPATGAYGVAAELRRSFVTRATALPEPGAGLLPGLAVGDTRAVPESLDDAMRVSGLSHLTAVSGANCAIVVGAVFWLTALCGASRAVRVLSAGAALAGFVVLVTPEPSVIRAAVMAAVAMLAVLLGRPSAGAGLLALCASGILIADPWLAATPGFALSVAASGALILLAPPLAAGMGRWMPAPIALAVAVPLAAQLVCGPIIALFAEQQSLVGVVANLVAAPAAPIATVLGLLACLATPFPPLADLLAACAWMPSAWIAATAVAASDLPFAQLSVVPGIGSALPVAVIGAAIGIVVIGRAGWARRSAAAVLIVCVSVGVGSLLLTGPLARMSTPDGWAIAACDIGQGDAALVRSGSQVALVDTGPDPAPLAACLRSLAIDRIDLLVLTHFDLDHAGGVDAVRGRVGLVLHRPTADAEDERILADLAVGGAEIVEASAGLQGTLGDATWRVLWPQRDAAAFPPGNDLGVIWEIGGGEVPHAIFLADLSAAAQRMLQRTAELDAGYAVVKVAHHGSADQEPSLYEAMRPAVALISVGVDNDYGHPRDEILGVLDAVGARTLRTDLNGRILVGLRGDELQVWTEKAVADPG